MRNNFLQFLSLTKRAGRLVEGYNKCEESIKKGEALLLIISEEASENTRSKFEKYKDDAGIPCIKGYSCVDLGNAIGRPEIHILCVTDKQMSEKLLSLYNSCQNNRG
jgi:Ribosomal protein HS6-type (S12/L30/L7a)